MRRAVATATPNPAPRAPPNRRFAPLPWRQSPGSLVGACKKSLGRLGVDQVALYIQHWPGEEAAGLGSSYQ